MFKVSSCKIYSFKYKLKLVSSIRGLDIVIVVFIIYLIIIIINYITSNNILVRLKNPTLLNYTGHPALPNLFHSTPIIQLYPTYHISRSTSTIQLYSNLSRSTPFINIYPTYLTLPHPFHFIPPITLYPTHPTLPNPIYKQEQKITNTNTNYEHPHQLHRLDMLFNIYTSFNN